MKQKYRCWTALLLAVSLLAGCSAAGQTKDLMQDVGTNAVDVLPDTDQGGASAADFCVRLFQNSLEKEKNTLLSPVSVLYALGMTANGAQGETKDQMEAVLGMNTQGLNEFLYVYADSLENSQEAAVHLANSIWLSQNARFTVQEDFLRINGEYYGADIFDAPFNASTVKEINDWVKENTDRMIPRILDQIPEEAVMYLINALSFEGKWTEDYVETQIREDVFTREDGTTQTVEFMYSSEYQYLETEKAVGFLKDYKGGRFAFAALLPKEGQSVEALVQTLSGAQLQALLANPQKLEVSVSIPKFETEYSTDLSKVLMEMGMVLPFDDFGADLSALGTSEDGNLYIQRVLHKTFITVAEQGTRAGAATAVEISNATSAAPQPEPKVVHLTRPFVYMIVDTQQHLPIFMGTRMDAEGGNP